MEKPMISMEMSPEAFTVLDCLAGIGLAVLAASAEAVEAEKAAKDVQQNLFLIASAPFGVREEVAEVMKKATAEAIEMIDKELKEEKEEEK